MSRQEEIEAYSKILKFQNKRSGMSTRDVVILIISLIVLIGGSFWLSSVTIDDYATLIFVIMAIYFLILAVAFMDFALGFGLFNENQVVYGGVIVLLTVILATIGTIAAETIYIDNAKLGSNDLTTDIIAFLGMTIYLVTAFIITYFIITATPTRQGREEMIRRLNEIRHEIEKVPVSKLGTKDATSRGLKWLQFEQRDDGIWGDENPLYETSQVLRTFGSLKQGLNYQWTRIVGGKEEIRTVEQTYFLVLEALDTAAIEPNYEMLLPFQTVTEIDPDQVRLDSEVFFDFKDEIRAISEWEFVQSLEEYDTRKSHISEIPIIFPMSLIFYLKKDMEVAQQCADIFSQTFDILIRRSQTRFSSHQSDKETSKLLLGMMYNSLTTMLRGQKKIGSGNILQDYQIQDDQGDQELKKYEGEQMDDMVLPDLDFSLEDDIELDEDGPSLPSFDFDDDDDMALPSMDFDSPSTPSSSGSGFDIDIDPAMNLDEDGDDIKKNKVKIEISMASIRNYIRELQSIDGSWDANLETTAECLYAVLDQESPESNFIKLGIHYLLALQEKNGSWANDIVLTAKILKVLMKINYSMSLGGF